MLAFTINTVSAYSHATFRLSDNLVFKEDIKGENRGFSLRRSTDVPRLTHYGYYDWSSSPNVGYPHPDSYRVSDRLALEGFRTFQQDSRDQTQLEFLKERRRHFFGFSYYPRYYGGFGGFGGSYGGFGGSYGRSYGGFGGYGGSYGSSYRYGF